MSAPHIPPIPFMPIADRDGRSTLEDTLWNQQLALSRGPWIPWTPTVTGLGVPTTLVAASIQHGKTVMFRLTIAGTSDGSFPTFTLPFATMSTAQIQNFATVNIVAAVPNNAAAAVGQGTSLVKLALAGGVAPTNGTAYLFSVCGTYESQ